MSAKAALGARMSDATDWDAAPRLGAPTDAAARAQLREVFGADVRARHAEWRGSGGG